MIQNLLTVLGGLSPILFAILVFQGMLLKARDEEIRQLRRKAHRDRIGLDTIDSPPNQLP